jgi:hypothetical protein
MRMYRHKGTLIALIAVAAILVIIILSVNPPPLRSRYQANTPVYLQDGTSAQEPGVTYGQITVPSVTGGVITSGMPVITLLGPNPDNTPYQGETRYREPGYRAVDREDGDITARVTYTDQQYEVNPGTYCSPYYTLRTYSVTDRNGNRAVAKRKITGNLIVRECAAPPTGY